MFTQTEENYLKAIYSISTLKDTTSVNTNDIAEKLHTKASSVTDMIQKLATKNLVNYIKYQGVTLTKKGLKSALLVVRKHRLWEVFLVEKLHFKWDEVHALAEQLEHIKSDILVDRLDALLQYPLHDPHGDPIPDKNGKLKATKEKLLSNCKQNENCLLVGVKDSSSAFLKYLDASKIKLGTKIKVLKKEDFDHSFIIEINKKQHAISQKIAKNLIIKKQ